VSTTPPSEEDSSVGGRGVPEKNSLLTKFMDFPAQGKPSESPIHRMPYGQERAYFNLDMRKRLDHRKGVENPRRSKGKNY